MTVDRSWLEVMKASKPDAFFPDAPVASTVFIDGQLRMQIPQGMDCWGEFFIGLYKRMIQRYLDMPGVTTLILGFDDHTNSPLAKGPTQAKRRSKCTLPEWNTLRPLPPTIPANYGELLLIRNFKFRVILYIIEQVKKHCTVRHGQRIVIDHQNRPFVAVGEGAVQAEGEIGEGCPAISALEFNIACPLGECDLKWVRYPAWGDMILDAVRPFPNP
jgi:hypothetical protein